MSSDNYDWFNFLDNLEPEQQVYPWQKETFDLLAQNPRSVAYPARRTKTPCSPVLAAYVRASGQAIDVTSLKEDGTTHVCRIYPFKKPDV